MRLRVSHRTVYRFEQPIRGVLQSHRLRPADNDGQRVLSWSVTVEGGETGAAFRDGAGDWIETVSLRGEVDGVVVAVAGEVETQDQSGVLRGHREQVHPAVYLRPARSTAPDHALRELARAAVAEQDSPLARAHALSAAVSAAVAYRPGETDAATSAAEALEQGRGVCQDMAHILIAAAIAADIPARYVAGYP